jgi:hypothetical protein
MRRQCKLKADFRNFKSLKEIFPEETVALLEENYDSVEDIDLIVGGSLESFNTFDRQLFGPTFSYIFRDQYRRFTSGDAYFFSHKTNPNPFTEPQLKAIKSVTLNHMICVNCKIASTVQNPYFVESSTNPKIPCSSFKLMDLTQWAEFTPFTGV